MSSCSVSSQGTHGGVRLPHASEPLSASGLCLSPTFSQLKGSQAGRNRDLSYVLVGRGNWVHCREVGSGRLMTISVTRISPPQVEEGAVGTQGFSRLLKCWLKCCLSVAFPFSPSQSGNSTLKHCPWLIKFSALWWSPGWRWSEAGEGEKTVLDYENLFPFCVSLYNFSLLNWSIIFHTVLL